MTVLLQKYHDKQPSRSLNLLNISKNKKITSKQKRQDAGARHGHARACGMHAAEAFQGPRLSHQPIAKLSL
jgi:hypothetical protein